MTLEQAIARRSSTDLEPIRRAVPLETRGLVQTLNRLFDQVSRRISSKDEFISNAAHQLRNPIAGVLALAEAVESAPNEDAAKSRSRELLEAARETSRLANQLLSFERARGSDISLTGAHLDICALGAEVNESVSQRARASDVEVSFQRPDAPVLVFGDRVMLKEGLLNLLTNALVHGGAHLSHIKLTIEASRQTALITVEDDGIGIPSDQRDQAKSRFGQAGGGRGSGLGLSIAAKVAENHGGTLDVGTPRKGASVRIALPIAEAKRRNSP